MPPLNDHAPNAFTSIEFVLTDMDETLTHHGRLAAATYDALERLQVSGIKVIPVTAAPVGWCDQMARMWPVDGVIGENGGLFLDAVPTGYTDWFYESWLSGQGGKQLCFNAHGKDVLTLICRSYIDTCIQPRSDLVVKGMLHLLRSRG